jgi:hypothetical protein
MNVYYQEPFDDGETASERVFVRACGVTITLILGYCILTTVAHAVVATTGTDIPPFSRSLLWMSLAHHTNSWRMWRDAHLAPPSPPVFV